jgi:hypothetical protein
MIRDEEADDPLFNTLALHGDASLNGAALQVLSVPAALQDALVKLDEPGQASLAERQLHLPMDDNYIAPS